MSLSLVGLCLVGCAAEVTAPHGLVIEESTGTRLAGRFASHGGGSTLAFVAAGEDGDGFSLRVTALDQLLVEADGLDLLTVDGVDVYRALEGDPAAVEALGLYGLGAEGRSLIELSAAIDEATIASELGASVAGALNLVRVALGGLAYCSDPYSCQNAFIECWAGCTRECYALHPPPDDAERLACISGCRSGCRLDREKCLNGSCR